MPHPPPKKILKWQPWVNNTINTYFWQNFFLLDESLNFSNFTQKSKKYCLRIRLNWTNTQQAIFIQLYHNALQQKFPLEYGNQAAQAVVKTSNNGSWQCHRKQNQWCREHSHLEVNRGNTGVKIRSNQSNFYLDGVSSYQSNAPNEPNDFRRWSDVYNSPRNINKIIWT